MNNQFNNKASKLQNLITRCSYHPQHSYAVY
jgi:hypothetical protein